jgi:hypothetical protein
MDTAILARIVPVVTVFPEQTGGFDPTNARPLAVATMQALGGETPESVDNETLFSDEKPVEQIVPDDHLIGRTLTVRVLARDRGGAQTRRMAIIELTGGKAKPFWIRYVE